jgi:hypothetical protein
MSPPVRWAAELVHVREVSLQGTADLTFWARRLAGEGLRPAERDGRAEVQVIAAEGRFWGVRFRELSFSVLVHPPREGAPQGAAYLVRAFNSVRFFAFCERAFFATPYLHGAVRLSAAVPASVQLVLGGEVVFAAEMGAGPRGPSRQGEEGWEGPVFLPRRRGATGPGKLFWARLRGQTCAYPFLPADAVTIQPATAGEALQALRESQFVGREWVVREDATHAKSKTYPRPEAPAG